MPTTTFLLLAMLMAPPSTVLEGPEGTLRWTITESGDRTTIEGDSPKWRVRHTASRDLRPRRTERWDDEGTRVVVEYTPEGATVILPGKTVEVEERDLWDGDTLDVRLGASVAAGVTDFDFRALDPASGKVYKFKARLQGQEQCDGVPCTYVRVTLGGLLEKLGPKWRYRFAADGKLLRFDGPIGSFSARGR